MKRDSLASLWVFVLWVFVLWVGLASVPLTGAFGQPVEIAEDWTLEKFDWSGPPGEADVMEIVNLYGDVRCRATDGAEVVVVANIQRHAEDPRRAEVTVEPGSDGRFAIRVSYPPVESESVEITAEMEKRRVDVSVLIPRGPRLEVETAQGLIEVKGLASPIVAETRGGNVFVKTSGPLEAKTEHGTVEVTFASTSWGGEAPKLETLTGDVTVWLPPEASVEVEAETRGEISTDYSVEIERRPPDGKKHVKAVIGEAENRIVIRTEKGRVRLFSSRF